MTANTMERLQQIAERIGGYGDPESDHSHADDDLCIVIRMLSEGTDYERIAKDIVSSFDAMTKWYA